MKIRTLLLFVILLIPGNIFSQTPKIDWLVDDSTTVDFDLDAADHVLILKKTVNGFVINKYNNRGILLWTASDTANINDPKRIMTDPSGNIYVTGNQRNFDRSVSYYVGQGVTRSFDLYHTSFCLDKFDENGNPVRKVKFKSSSSVSGIHIKSWSFDHENNLVFCANTSNGDTVNIDTCAIGYRDNTWPSGSVQFNVKLDTLGTVVWLKEYPYYVNPKKTFVDPDDNMITIGSSRCQLITDSVYQTGCYGLSDGWIIKYNSAGNRLWSSHIGSRADDEIKDITMNDKGEYVFSLSMGDTIGHYDDLTFQPGGPSCTYGGSSFIVSMDENGKLKWIKPINLCYTVYNDLAVAASGINTLLGMTFENTLEYAGLNLSSQAPHKACVIKTDSTGNPVWSKLFGLDPDYTKFDKFVSDHSENAFVLGSYYSPIQIDEYTLTSAKGRFFCKLLNDSFSGTNPTQLERKSRLLIYPNPATTSITIKSDTMENGADLFIYNFSGQELSQQKVQGNIPVMDIGHLTSGIYFLKLVSGERVMTGKIIKN